MLALKNNMITVGISRSTHNGSIALLKNNEVIFFIESERLSNIKHDKYIFQAINKIKDYTTYIDNLVLTGMTVSSNYESYDQIDAYSAAIVGLNKTFKDHGFNTYDFWSNHHAMHAATSFYNSGFKKALCIVKDGMGSDYYLNEIINEDYFLGREIGSSFIMEYPATISMVEQNIITPYKLKESKVKIKDNIFITNSISEGNAFELVSEKFGFTPMDAGKVMGMSAYGKKNKKIPPIYKNNLINNDLFTFIDNDVRKQKLNFEFNDDFQFKADFAYSLQTEIQENVMEEIINKIKKTQENNLCLSGGFFLNCVSNYHLLKNLPKNINIYIEPISSDAGNAIGAAKFLYHYLTQSKEILSQKNIYYGLSYNYSKDDLNNENYVENITPKEVAKLISEKNIVAIYQGRSEAGPRALGNRSILYDPRDPYGKDHVNIVKQREWFRPFAGSVLKEKATEWFDLKSLDESKFMMFAVDVLKDKQNIIPAITHVDGTCRIQTVSKEDNENFYNLIEEFYKITSVPILFNTSFNLAGNTIVETLEDALWTLKNSKINYLYLPEMCILIKNPNDIIEQ
jgi:carbamoyltransferase